VAKRNGDRKNLRPLPLWHAIEIAHQLLEKIVGIQLLNDLFQEGAGPRQRGRACGKAPHDVRTQLRPPPLSIELLLGSSGVFEQTIDVGEQLTDLAHGGTSPNEGTRVVRRLCGWAWAGPRVLCE
jgi:hypothetical protein